MARKKYRRHSRLSRREKKKYNRQTILFTFLTIFLIIAIIFWGIPSLIRMAIFLGDLRSSSQPITGQDAIPPPPPILQPLFEATSSAAIRVEGFAEEGSTVVLSINGSDAYEVLVESDGEFLFNQVRLKSGENKIIARSIDTSSNESRPSSTFTVIYDVDPPKLEVSSPDDGASFYGFSERNIRVNGTADKDSVVRINNAFIILSQEGTFSHLFALSTGENVIRIVARDRAGNETIEERTVNYEE